MAYKMKQDLVVNHNDSNAMIARKLNGTRSPPSSGAPSPSHPLTLTNSPPPSFPERPGSTITTSPAGLNPGINVRSKSAMALKVDIPSTSGAVSPGPPNNPTSPPSRPAVSGRPNAPVGQPSRPNPAPQNLGPTSPTNTQPPGLQPQPPRVQGRPLPPQQPPQSQSSLSNQATSTSTSIPTQSQSSNSQIQPVPISRPQPQRPPPQITKQPPQPPQPQKPLQSQQLQRPPPPIPQQAESSLPQQPPQSLPKQQAAFKQAPPIPKHPPQNATHSQPSPQPPLQRSLSPPPQQPPPHTPNQPPSTLSKPLQNQSPSLQASRSQPQPPQPSQSTRPQPQPQSPTQQQSQSPRPQPQPPASQPSQSPRPQPQSPAPQLPQSPRSQPQPQSTPQPSQSPRPQPQSPASQSPRSAPQSPSQTFQPRAFPQTPPAQSPMPSLAQSPQVPRAQPPSQRPPSRVLSPSSVQAQSSQPLSPQSQSPRPQSPPGQSPQHPQSNHPQPFRPPSQPTSPTSPSGASQKLPPKFPIRPLASSAPAATQNVPALSHHASVPNLPSSSRLPPHPTARPNGTAATTNNTASSSGSSGVSSAGARGATSPRSAVPLVRSQSVVLGSGEVSRPGSTTLRKGPPVSPRRATSAVPVRVPLMERLTEQDIAKIIRVQSYIRGWVLRRKFKKRVKDNIHRTKVVKELLSSEETYVIGLNVINTTYLEQLTWNAKVSPNPLLTTEQINTIFSTVSGIVSFNRTLLEKLRERVDAWSPTQVIGDVFLTMAPFLKLYTTYCTNYDQAIQTLQKAKQASNFATFLETCLKSTTHTLDSLLITVVQRIPRYILLLQDFIKHTWPEHVDFVSLTNALKSVQDIQPIVVVNQIDIAEKLNKGIGEAESLNKVIALQNTIVGINVPLVTPSRMYVRDGPIAECTLEAKAGKEYGKYWYFLFNDSLIVTERKKDDKYQMREMVDFSADTSMKIKDVPDNLVVQNAFQIVSPTLSLFLACQDAATKAAILEQTKLFREQISHRRNLAKPQQAEQSPAPTQLTVTIPRTETCKDGKKEYTLYHTKIRDDQTKKGTMISKRYSEFDHLHKALKKEFPEMDFMDLPKKHLVGSLSKETVESRRVMLEMYLQALVQRPEVRCCPTFHDFISGYTAPPSAKKPSKKSSSEG